VALYTDYEDLEVPSGAKSELPANGPRGLNAITQQVNTNTANIATVTSTANTALSAASDAQTTAGNAAANASNALSTAEDAEAAANSAVSTANDASTAADDATTAAATAQSTADDAVAAAAAAQSTADDALPKPVGFPDDTKIIAGDGTLIDPPVGGGGGEGVPPYRTNIGNGSAGPYTVNHNRGTKDFIPAIFRNPGHIANNGSGAQVHIPVIPIDEDSALIDTSKTWETNQLRFLMWPLTGGDLTPPASPTLSEVSKTATDISLSATAGASCYIWMRDDVEIARTAGNTYTHEGLTPDTEYDFKVIVLDLMANTAESSVVAITTDTSSDTTPPTKATATFVSKTETTVTIAASGGTDNVAVTGYHHYRDGVKITTVPQSLGNYQHTGLTGNTEYSFAVSAVDAASNEGPLSDAVLVTTDSAAPPADVTLNVNGAGSRQTSGSSVVGSLNVGAGTNRFAFATVTVSHSTSNNPATYDTASLVSSLDGAWTYWGAQMVGQFSAQKQGAILLFYKDDPVVGNHTLTATVAKAGLSLTKIEIHSICYNGCGGFDTPVTGDINSSGSLNVALTPDDGEMAFCASVRIGVATSPNYNVRYNNGQSVTGTGDYHLVQDVEGDGAVKTFTASSSVHSYIAFILQKAA